MIEIQLTMSERAVELLCLPENQPCHLIDLGCGSGLSGETLTEQGHIWTGVDISSAMLGNLQQLMYFEILHTNEITYFFDLKRSGKGKRS